MKFLSIAIVLIWIATKGSTAGQSPAEPKAACDVVVRALREVQNVKPGMTRRDLLKQFIGEGGVSNRLQRTYVLKTCPYVKVDVEFEIPPGQGGSTAEGLSDKIADISRPYLGCTVTD
jgi:hypothetical protein